MIRTVVALGLGLALTAVSSGTAFAGAPGPPATPPPHQGPPPPPTATPTATVVPTISPPIVPALPVVNVHFKVKKVQRGHNIMVSVDASTSDAVTVTVHYHKGKPQVFHGRVGSSGNYTKKWKVPKSAATGKAKLVVSVHTSGVKYQKTLAFTVV